MTYHKNVNIISGDILTSACADSSRTGVYSPTSTNISTYSLGQRTLKQFIDIANASDKDGLWPSIRERTTRLSVTTFSNSGKYIAYTYSITSTAWRAPGYSGVTILNLETMDRVSIPMVTSQVRFLFSETDKYVAIASTNLGTAYVVDLETMTYKKYGSIQFANAVYIGDQLYFTSSNSAKATPLGMYDYDTNSATPVTSEQNVGEPTRSYYRMCYHKDINMLVGLISKTGSSTTWLRYVDASTMTTVREFNLDIALSARNGYVGIYENKLWVIDGTSPLKVIYNVDGVSTPSIKSLSSISTSLLHWWPTAYCSIDGTLYFNTLAADSATGTNFAHNCGIACLDLKNFNPATAEIRYMDINNQFIDSLGLHPDHKKRYVYGHVKDLSNNPLKREILVLDERTKSTIARGESDVATGYFEIEVYSKDKVIMLCRGEGAEISKVIGNMTPSEEKPE